MKWIPDGTESKDHALSLYGPPSSTKVGCHFSPSGLTSWKRIPSYLLSPGLMTLVPSLWYCWRSFKCITILVEITLATLTAKLWHPRGLKEEFLSTLTKSSQWEAGGSGWELYCIEQYMDPGSRILLPYTAWHQHQSEDRAREGIM